MPRFWSLKLPRIEHLPMPRTLSLPSSQTSKRAVSAFFGAHALGSFQGPALFSSVVRKVVAWQGSIRLSALRQPAHQIAAPKCHTPSSCWPPVLRQSANQSGTPTLFTPSPGGLPVLRRPAQHLSSSQLRAPQAESLAIRAKGSRAMQRPNVNEHSTAGLFATSVASCPSLTGRSTRTSMLRMAAG
jgi:hypothetical protein